MEEKMTALKAAITALFGAMASFLGWKGVLAAVWVILMLTDYVSGSLAACQKGSWNSKAAREGLFHKGGMILVVLVAIAADLALAVASEYLALGIAWPGIIFPLVLTWYIITEAGSILENAAKMGAPVPKWLINLMTVSIKAVETLGNASAGQPTQTLSEEAPEEKTAAELIEE